MVDATSFDETRRARTVIDHARTSASSFFESYSIVRRERGAGSRAPTNTEQDLSRAGLVFAAAGLDSSIKELIRGAVPALALLDDGVRNGLESFVRSRLRKDQEAGGNARNRLLAQLLLVDCPSDVLLEEYVLDLTGSSLQSSEELKRTAKALDIEVNLLSDERDELKDAFEIRNKIIHELDVKFGAGRGQRKRNSRRKDDLEAKAHLLLDVGDSFIEAVEQKLAEYQE